MQRTFVNNYGRKTSVRPGLREFSKKIIAAVTVLWFCGALFGIIAVTVQLARGDYVVSLDALLTYIGAPMSGGVIGYMLKSAFENREKIRFGQTDGEI